MKGTPLENYAGTIVHDHDTTFYKYGTGHQECTQHDIRYLTGSIQNEAELEWNKQMLELFRKMLHYRNSLSENEGLSPIIVSEFEAEYDRILETAEKEYTDEPPNDYYREGYNLFLRLRKYKENELLFLHDKRVPANNSLCERLARVPLPMARFIMSIIRLILLAVYSLIRSCKASCSSRGLVKRSLSSLADIPKFPFLPFSPRSAKSRIIWDVPSVMTKNNALNPRMLLC